MYEHDFPQTDAEWELTTHNPVTGYTLQLSKVGGGTVGKSYGGYWHYRLTGPEGHPSEAGSDFRTGTPKTHSQAARILLDEA